MRRIRQIKDFAERGRRGMCGRRSQILARAGVSKPSVDGDELPLLARRSWTVSHFTECVVSKFALSRVRRDWSRGTIDAVSSIKRLLLHRRRGLDERAALEVKGDDREWRRTGVGRRRSSAPHEPLQQVPLRDGGAHNPSSPSDPSPSSSSTTSSSSSVSRRHTSSAHRSVVSSSTAPVSNRYRTCRCLRFVWRGIRVPEIRGQQGAFDGRVGRSDFGRALRRGHHLLQSPAGAGSSDDIESWRGVRPNDGRGTVVKHLFAFRPHRQARREGGAPARHLGLSLPGCRTRARADRSGCLSSSSARRVPAHSFGLLRALRRDVLHRRRRCPFSLRSSASRPAVRQA